MLNAVKGFFAKLSLRRLKRGTFHSLVDLQAAINGIAPCGPGLLRGAAGVIATLRQR